MYPWHDLALVQTRKFTLASCANGLVMIPGESNAASNRQDEIELKKNEILMLKSCLNMKRLKLSAAINDIKNYCFEHVDADQLINASKDDPFKNKKKCALL
ncbi:hypothetical protein TcWFU_007036 [Taenia crassiceps]|uniref:G protein gamma domain-containing protein n=1 Tax=Taenia crassiceps TaxID=6207 RepID=A0ABR4QEI5_9CEST